MDRNDGNRPGSRHDPETFCETFALPTFLFPELPSSHKAIPHISTNIIANILGLGWAATPAGLNAMQALSDLEKERRSGKAPGPVLPPGTASKEM